MSDKDTRWIQRFYNYRKALEQLRKAVLYAKTQNLSNLEKQGLIQAFEFTHELAWKVMKDYLLEIGGINTLGSKDATKEAFATNELIKNGEIWMEMIKSRNQTSHTYNEETAEYIYSRIMDMYFNPFQLFEQTMLNKL